EGPPTHMQAARQFTFGMTATIDAITHGVPDLQNAIFCFRFTTPCLLILHHYLTYAHSCFHAPVQELIGGINGKRQFYYLLVATHLAVKRTIGNSLFRHKATPYGVECFPDAVTICKLREKG